MAGATALAWTVIGWAAAAGAGYDRQVPGKGGVQVKTRTEEDLLGEREVPAQAYYGIHTLRATENFRFSPLTVSGLPELIRGMVMVKKASALANKELATIPAEVADAIVAACDDILVRGRCLDQFPVDVYQGGPARR